MKVLDQEENILAQLQVAPGHTLVLDFIKKLKQQLGVTDKECDIVCGYEAGCLGYTLYHPTWLPIFMLINFSEMLVI